MKQKIHKEKKLFAAIVAVITIVLLITLTIKPSSYSESISLDSRSHNTNLAAALFAAGIQDPLVDVTEERAYVAYDLPTGYDSNTTQRFVAGAASQTNSKMIIVLQYSNGEPALVWTINSEDMDAFMRGEIDSQMLENRIEKNEF